MNILSSRCRTTQVDVARVLGLNQSTVSLALRNSPRIPAASRHKIQSAAHRMGYRFNCVATALAQLKHKSISPRHQSPIAWLKAAVKSGSVEDLDALDCYRGAKACAEKLGYRLDEFRFGGDLAFPKLERILIERGIRGILLLPQAPQVDSSTFSWERFSVVQLCRSIDKVRFHVVAPDEVANVNLAFEKTWERGYERIGFISGRPEEAMLVEAGYWLAQQKLDRFPLPILRLRGEDIWSNQRELCRWVKKEKPDAIVTDRPYIADLLKMGDYRVPEDVGLVTTSISDHPGIRQDFEEIGRVAVLELHSLINDSDTGIPCIPREILVKGSWVDGASLPRRW